jgi:hypothetical protein
LLDFITPSNNLIYLSLTGSTREEILKDLLDKLIQETLKNLSVTHEGTQEIYRLDDNLYEQTIYRVEFTTPSNASKVDPDNVV